MPRHLAPSSCRRICELDVNVTPLPLSGPDEDPSLGRLSIEKEFRGDFVGRGRGQMLTAMTGVEGRQHRYDLAYKLPALR